MTTLTASAVLDRTLTQAEFDRFARLSGDDNPIHVDPDFCARTRFGRTVAHGVLLCSILRGLADRIAPGARQVSQAVRFPAPTYAGEPMRFEAWQDPAGAAGEGIPVNLRVSRIADGTVTCDGTCILDPDGRSGFPPPPDTAAPPSATVAEVTRRFGAADVADWLALGGAAPPGGVPEPLIGALFSYLLGVRLPGLGTNYLKQETRFHAPAPLEEALTARVAVTRVRPEKALVDLETTCRTAAGTLVASGRALVFVGDVADPPRA